MKTCFKCKEEKELDNFGKDNSKRDKFSIYCKVCLISKKRIITNEDKDKKLEYNKKFKSAGTIKVDNNN